MNLFTNLNNPFSNLYMYILNIFTYKYKYNLIFNLIEPYTHEYIITFDFDLFNIWA